MFFGIFILVVGIVLLLRNLGYLIYPVWDIIWPLVIIIMGLRLISNSYMTPLHRRIHHNPLKSLHGRIHRDPFHSSKQEPSEDELDEFNLFWGEDKKIKSQNFKGGSLVCIFGRMDLDLSEAKISEQGAELEIVCVFGEVAVKIPRDCRIESFGENVMGSWEEHLSDKEEMTGPVMKITGAVVFGGVEMKD